MYAEQDLYKFLERIAVALEKLANSPVTGNAPASTPPTPKPSVTPRPVMPTNLKQ
jgi:hypothetical protein